MFQQSLTFSAIVAQLRKLCQEKQTGTLYFLENGHLLGQASLRDGEIISLMAKKKHGTDALSCLLDIQNGGIAFAPGTLSATRMALPPTAEILAILDSFISHGAATHSNSLPSSAPPALTAIAQTVLEQTLKEFIGPIANMVCADHFRGATTLAAAIDALADEIPNPKAAAQFRERVQRRLQ
ncbi:MAG: DUF4388 domain-containing protein [Candidatus Competibacteraceae bacterium]|nr:DUF4388 domain-containing protein [Candidatus Competibacteraceae bacterium]MBK8896115.1 DUF4388 domain-containing protein [Candidatus Competibacteraceae bacterium]MBK8964274.1 DUF4388 domain-containing protein [Candidatus Competibacteraceae bacterium]MBK9950361.1 DUF4388 domain-containing protein [Candidatus Competibacteraceae bacterium]